MKQKTRRTTEEQATEDNQNVKEKKPTRTERGNTQEETRYSQPEFPTQVRPPERSNNTRQDHPNTKKGQHQQGETNHNRRSKNSNRNAKDDANKVFRRLPTTLAGLDAR